MGTKIGIILVDEEDTKENLIGGKQKKCRCIAKVTRTHQAIQVAAIRTRLKPVYPPLKKASDGVMFPNRPKRHYSQYALFIQGFAQIFQPGFSRQAGTGLLQSPM